MVNFYAFEKDDIQDNSGQIKATRLWYLLTDYSLGTQIRIIFGGVWEGCGMVEFTAKVAV